MQIDHSPSSERKPTKIKVTVVYNGVDKPIIVESHASVQSLLQQAIHLFAITSQPHLLSLFRADGTKVDEQQSIEGADLTSESVLYLRQDSVKGG